MKFFEQKYEFNNEKSKEKHKLAFLDMAVYVDEKKSLL